MSLIEAAAAGDVAQIAALIGAGASVDGQLMDHPVLGSCTGGPLVAAINGGHEDAVQALLKAGANPEGVGTENQSGRIQVYTPLESPLKKATVRYYKAIRIFDMLREAGATR